MLSCGTCNSQMLEYLYDLLEGDERQAWEAHLTECASCQAELERTRAQQRLLARAAKMDFSHMRFELPPAGGSGLPPVAGGTGVSPVATDFALSPRPIAIRPQRWRRWLAAASVLVAASVAGAAGWLVRDYHRTEDAIAQAEHRLEQAKKDRLEAEQQLALLPQQKQEQIATLHKKQQDSQLQVEIQGPATIRVGAPTDYQIFTRDLNNRQPTAAKVSVEVKDHGQTIAKPLAVTQERPGVYRLTLPADLPVRPDSQPTL